MAFRRRYFTSRTALQHSLEAFMQSYNHERPHQGYRVRGRSPSRALLGRRAGMTSYRTLGCPRCLHHCESGQTEAELVDGPGRMVGARSGLDRSVETKGSP